MQKLVSSGHRKNEVINFYTRAELKLFYEKIILAEARKKADDIEAVFAGIGAAFGGKDKIDKLLQELRKGGE